MSKELSKKVAETKEELKEAIQKEFEERAQGYAKEELELQKKWEVKPVPVMLRYGLNLELANIKEQKNEDQTKK